MTSWAPACPVCDVLDAGAAARGYPYGVIRSAVLSINGGPPIDVTHLSRRATAAQLVADALAPMPLVSNLDAAGAPVAKVTGGELAAAHYWGML